MGKIRRYKNREKQRKIEQKQGRAKKRGKSNMVYIEGKGTKAKGEEEGYDVRVWIKTINMADSDFSFLMFFFKKKFSSLFQKNY